MSGKDNKKRKKSPASRAVDTKTAADGLPPLRAVIADRGLRAKKSLGQNFILDLNLTRRIARLGGPLAGRSVVEIGPGPGGLTRALFLEGAARVFAVERDERCLAAMEEIAERYQGRLFVHVGDALETNWPGRLSETVWHCGDGLLLDDPNERPVVIANLPYNIATQLLVNWLESEPWPPWFDKLVLMFQREVAERIVATHGTKAYGRLAVLAQWRCEARIAMRLKPEAFTPPPRVASAVVELVPRQSPTPECSVAVLSRVTAAAFGQRRKMLRQSLKSLTAMPELLLERASISPELRAEELTVGDFARLAEIFGGGANC